MKILGIESSCDETSVAVVEDGRKVLSNVISSQVAIHKLYGGVVPEIASRNHVLAIDNCFMQALVDANCTMDDIDAIAVTHGAGLLGALIVGVNFAKGLALASKKPLIGVNHIEGHISANYISNPQLEPPFVCLVVSGGHTALFEIAKYTSKKLIETTTDDAIGESFDKVARVLGMEYPGGPNVSKEAKKGRPTIEFISSKSVKKRDSFSYSGLKTAVVNYVHNKIQKNEILNVPDICASFEEQATNQVAFAAIDACKKRSIKKLAIAGGVSANAKLREKLESLCKQNSIDFFKPEPILCTDNAAMIASMAFFQIKYGKNPYKDFVPSANLPLS